MVFFDPTKKFLSWLADYAKNRIVVDVGCGDGELIRRLRKYDCRIIGIDPLYKYENVPIDLCSSIFPVEAEECDLLKTLHNALILFCRPCHIDFVKRTLDILPE